jgi:hypothetical protein
VVGAMSSEDPSDYETTPYLDSSDCTPYQGESREKEREEGRYLLACWLNKDR